MGGITQLPVEEDGPQVGGASGCQSQMSSLSSEEVSGENA